MADSKVEPAAANRRPPNAGKGRVKGTPNKVTKALKEMILGALDEAGGQDYLKRQATENPTAFLTLLGKVLPAEIKAEHSNPDGESFRVASKPDLSGLTEEQLRVLASIAR